MGKSIRYRSDRFIFKNVPASIIVVELKTPRRLVPCETKKVWIN